MSYREDNVPTNRSYGDGCGIARALDVVGERWALLVVRELILGPQRFTDLRQSLASASSNLVADRLRELTERGVVRRHRLPPPAASWVYELTDWGRRLEPIVIALGEWGLRAPFPPQPTVGATSVLLFLRTAGRPDPGDPPSTGRVELAGRVWTVRTAAGRTEIAPGGPPAPEYDLRTDPATLNAALDAPDTLDTALRDGRATFSGDRGALDRLLRAVARQSPVGEHPPQP
ncbi:winged helix-turn-helix transcriptional regulator [Micromonospora sp. AKA38]|uniref:winged helix-turn-helix transcriptional regulator n=1 Tax=Micromonospora sp. AKA38 TaxID=2733861 RepID=UPI0024938BF2|nr:winged helix-turn-helix transcriptional regulator [Micromonospora sp. AKA38]